MSTWDKTSKLPSSLTRADKRSVIATDRGFVRRQKYTDVHSNVRIKDELLVPINGLANSTNFGSPSVSDIWFTSGTATANTEVTINLTFDEPVSHNGLAGDIRMAVANTAGGAAGLVATHTANSSSVTGASNFIEFTFTPTVAGSYTISAQTLANVTSTAINLRSLNTGTEAVALTVNTAIAATVGTLVVGA